MSRDLRRRMMREKASNIVFTLNSQSKSEVREDGTATMQRGANNAIKFTIDAERGAVYRIHIRHNGAAFSLPEGTSSHPYSFLQNDTFPSYVSTIKSGDSDVSFYLPLQKGNNSLRFWTERNELVVYGVAASSVSHDVAFAPTKYYDPIVIFGETMLDFTETPGKDKPQGWQTDNRCYMLRAKASKKDGVTVVETDALSIKADVLATIPRRRYRVGLCCAVDKTKVISFQFGPGKATANVKSDTNTSKGVAYVDTGIVVEDVTTNGLSVMLGEGSSWVNVGAIVLQRIS